jgi:RAC serine/threonine-protein kinase
MQLTRMIERSFHADTEAECKDWIRCYRQVQQKLNEEISSVALAGQVRAMSFLEGDARPCNISLDDFEMLKVLGKGTFGKVLLAKQKGTNNVYAIKVLKKETILQKDELAHTLTENHVLAKCAHPFLTSLKYSFQTSDLLCFVMEYVNGGEVRTDVDACAGLLSGLFVSYL